jgi:hypothetical protein
VHDDQPRPLRRREFLALVGSLPVLPAVWPQPLRASWLFGPDPTAGVSTSPTTASARAANLHALAGAVLPSSLGDAGAARAAARFQAWLDGSAPGAELDHGYGSGTIRHMPDTDPRPAWAAQLDELDVAARQSSGTTFDALDAAARRAIVRDKLEAADVRRLGSPLSAPHVAAALLAWWYGTPDAHDLAHGARIGKDTCRPLDAVTARPAPIPEGEP